MDSRFRGNDSILQVVLSMPTSSRSLVNECNLIAGSRAATPASRRHASIIRVTLLAIG
jgi:hypothetical protein